MNKEKVNALAQMLNEVSRQNGKIKIKHEISGWEIYYETKNGGIITVGMAETFNDAVRCLIENVVAISNNTIQKKGVK